MFRTRSNNETHRKNRKKIIQNRQQKQNLTTDTDTEHVVLNHCRRNHLQISRVFLRVRGFLPPNDYGDTGGCPANYCIVESGTRLYFILFLRSCRNLRFQRYTIITPYG